MRRSGALFLALVAAAVPAGCGSEADEPKRAVDARTEAIHFFPADQPFLALLDTSTPQSAELARTVRALSTVDALQAFTAGAGFLPRAGLDLRPLTDLLTDDDSEDGLAASQAALGLTPSGGPAEDVLLVLVSERSEEMEAAVEGVAADSGLVESGSFHEARLFGGEQTALAVRDGVVVIGPDAARLRAALSLRDSDQDEQLDEDQVADVLNELPAQPPLLAYADMEALQGSDPAVGALALNEREWIGSLREAAIAVTPGAAAIRVEVHAEVEPGESAAIPFGERPVEADFAARDAERLVSGEPARTSAFHDAVVSLAPFLARATVSDDQLRATIIGSR